MPFGPVEAPQLTVAGRPAQLLGFGCLQGTVDAVVLPAVVGIPQPSSIVIRPAGGSEVFLAGLDPAAAAALRGRTVTACGWLVRFFGTGPFAGQSVVGIVPFFLF